MSVSQLSLAEPSLSLPVWEAGLDVEQIRRHFPILRKRVRGKPLVYLDNAATTQKPQAVIDTVARYYAAENANIHRGVHLLSQQATFAYERSRGRVSHLLNATEPAEIVFTRGTTESINLVAQTYGRQRVGPGDEIVVSHMEHHSNIVPWQLLCQEKGARLRVAPIDERGEFLLDEYEKLLTERTRLVAVTHASNALGTVTPVPEIAALAHARGVPVLVDGAQAVPHLEIDVQQLGCDFYAFSGHKLFGPTGIGVLYGRRALLESMPPWQGGGDMIRSVSFEKTTFNDLPYKFEAGTPHIAGVLGLETAIGYLEAIGRQRIAAYEARLLTYATEALSQVEGLRLVGTARDKVGVLSFAMDQAHPHDIGTILDAEGIAIRTGHHCAQPVMQRFGVPATARASLAFYNTPAEIDALVAALRKVAEVFG